MSEPKSVVIVGGGIIGIASAHYLSRAGYSVTVIDESRIAGACSHGNCGYICPSHVLPLTEPGAIKLAMKSMFKPDAPFRVKPRFSPALWSWMAQFALRCNRKQMLSGAVHLKAILDSAMSEYRLLVTDEGLDCEWKDTGLLYVLKSQAGMNDFAHTDQLLTDEFGVSADRIEGSDLSDFEPALKAGLAGAFHYPGDAMLRPDVLAKNWTARLREQGVTFIENCGLEGIEKSDGKIIRIQTSNGPLAADQFVFATGAKMAQLAKQLECRIPIQPGKGYSLTMARPAICPAVPMLFPEHKVGVTPFDGAYRLGSMMEFSGYDDSIRPQRIQQLRTSAEPYLRDPHTDAVEEEWYGWRPMTWDSLPIIGRSPGLSNTFLAAGHNMLGLSLAPATGRLIAEIMQGEEPHLDVSAFSPTRF
jgi:D-amino-acid dehydrogenase